MNFKEIIKSVLMFSPIVIIVTLFTTINILCISNEIIRSVITFFGGLIVIIFGINWIEWISDKFDK